MAASIEIGVGQALGGGPKIAAGLNGASATGKISLGGISTAAPAESFQSRWQSMLALLGKQSAQPDSAVTETAALDHPEDECVGSVNARSASQRAGAALTGESVQGARAATPSQAATASQAFGAKTVRSQTLLAAQPQQNPTAAVSSESAELTSASRSVSASSRKPGKQSDDEKSAAPTTHGADQTTSSSSSVSIAPVPIVPAHVIGPAETANAFSAAAPIPRSMKSEAVSESMPTVAGAVQPEMVSPGNEAIEKPATAPPANGRRTSDPAVAPHHVASAAIGPAEPGEAVRGLSSTAETTSTAGRARELIGSPPSRPDPDATGMHLPAAVAAQSRIPEPDLQAAEKSLLEGNAGSNAGQAPLTRAAGSASTPSITTALRSGRAGGSSEVAAQPIAVADAAAASHASGGWHGELNPVAPRAINATGTTGAAGSRETFAALDAEPGNSTPTWIHAGAQHAEAGFNDPALGWVGVRADTGPGGVHAAIVSGSADATQTLSSHMAGLNAHLAAEQVSVESLRLDTATGHGGQGAMQQGTAQNNEQGAQQSNTGAAPAANRSNSLGDSSAVTNSGAEAFSEPAQPFNGYDSNGAHISVVA
jgi:hypothetical protein